jgi:hypothetical protein
MIRTQQKQQYKANTNDCEVKGDNRDEKQINSTNKCKTQNKLTLYFCFASGSYVHSTISSDMNTRLWINYLNRKCAEWKMSGI